MTFKRMANGEVIPKALSDALSLKWLRYFHSNHPEKYETTLRFEPSILNSKESLKYDFYARVTNTGPNTVGMKFEGWQVKFELQYDVNNGLLVDSIEGHYAFEKDREKPVLEIQDEDLALLFKAISLEVRQVATPTIKEELVEVSTDFLEAFLTVDDENKFPEFLRQLADFIGELSKDTVYAKLLLRVTQVASSQLSDGFTI